MHRQSKIRRETFHRLPGEPVQNVALFQRAWDECAELQVQDQPTWVGQAIFALSELERFEIAAIDGTSVVGAVVLAGDSWDAHVGPCMSVFAQYVLPEYRNVGISRMLMRECMRIARCTAGVRVLAFTHRKAPWRYETIYRRIR